MIGAAALLRRVRDHVTTAPHFDRITGECQCSCPDCLPLGCDAPGATPAGADHPERIP